MENEITFKRLFHTLDTVEKAVAEGDLMARPLFMFRLMFREPGGDDLPNITSLGDLSPPTLSSEPAIPLNASQKRAVQAALDAAEFHLIHGPPGTGKTSTICEIVRRSLQSGKRILLCAPSNCAVDNALLKIIHSHCVPKGIELLRFGDSERMDDQLSAFSLHQLVHNRDGYDLIKQVEKEITRAEKKQHYREKTALLAEKKRRLSNLRRTCLAGANLVACTLNSAGHPQLDKEMFDLCIIDEASQALAVESCIAIAKARKVILVGDPMQLPPVTLSNQSELEISLMETLVAKHAFNGKHFTHLDVQYRMHEAISRWSSGEFYDGKIRTDPSIESLLLSDMDGIQETYETAQPIMFCDTSDYGFREYTDGGGRSKMNMGEVDIAVAHITRLLAAGVPAADIGVITPYSAQAAHISRGLAELGIEGGKVEVNTVDAFQGREKLVVVLSLVRNNDTHDIGFLGERRRLNVAMTRARRHLLVIGDVHTASFSAFMQRLWDFIEENAAFVDLG